MKISRIIITFAIGALVVVACSSTKTVPEAQKKEFVSDSIKPSEETRQEDVQYGAMLLRYHGVDRDELRKEFGVPTQTIKVGNDLLWEWPSVDIQIAGKKNVQVSLSAKFGTGSDKESRSVRELAVSFFPDLDGAHFVPLGSNCATLIDSLKDRKFYAKTSCESDNEYYIVGTLNGVDVSITNHSSVWPFVSEPSIDENGMRKETLKTNPGFDWKVGHVNSITVGPRPKSGGPYLGTIETQAKNGIVQLVEGI
ncbi:MAG TPA: hypothetical protein VMQ44_03515 [Candidatus Saccharimonadales bacterium]|nr:hypothetical protein [Candidatus Saccharimonadales bacterium]